jgi:uncharacterized membrane protein
MATADPVPTSPDRHRLLDDTFKISMILKGLDGVLEAVGGILLLTIAPARINRLIIHLTQHELSRHDFIARHLIHVGANLHKTQLFGALYLLSHGVAKIVLVAGLLRRQAWAYPATFIFLGAFIIYQLYRMFYGLTVGLVLLTAFDLFILWLVWREYQVHRVKGWPSPSEFAP